MTQKNQFASCAGRARLVLVALCVALALGACQTTAPVSAPSSAPTSVAAIAPVAPVAPAPLKPLMANMDLKLWTTLGQFMCATDWVCGQHTGPKSYLFMQDKAITKSGTGSASLERTGPEDWGTMWQSVDFRAIAGRTIRVAADIKRAGVVGKGGGLSFVGSGSNDAPITDKFIEGTNDWRREEIVVIVPRTLTNARVGFALEGSGKIWVDNFVLEILPK